jgi:hypothetical protein
MNTILRVLFGLAVLSLPLALAGGVVAVLAASLSLLPLLFPLTTLLAVGALAVAWVRHRRSR